MKKTVNTSHVRFINLRAVLDAIYHQESISKAELARMLNMSKPSMADNVTDLLEIGIIREIGEGACGKGGGRKPTLLSFCDDFKYIIAMDFHYHHSFFALSNLKGKVLNEFTIHQTPMSNFRAWTQMCVNAVSTLLSAQNITSQDLAAIAVSAPGILNTKEDQYIISSKFGEFNVAYLEKELKQAFQAPVLIKNSTNAAALGEFYYGSGQNCENLLYVSCGQGVGSGLILRGKLYEGSHLAAGEFGFFMTPDNLESKTGGRLEDRISIDSILEAINSGLEAEQAVSGQSREGGKVSFPAMIERWKSKDPYIQPFVDKICLELGCAVTSLQSFFDCQLIIIGGEYLAFAQQMIPEINRLVQSCCPIPVPVVAASLGDNGTVLGLIATCREFYFKNICSRE